MTQLTTRDLTPAFGSEVIGVDLSVDLEAPTLATLREVFDRRGVLVFRDADLSHSQQVRLCRALCDDATDGPTDDAMPEDRWYISNKRDKSAAPFGRLQFHSDTMWASDPCLVLSLYGVEVDQPAVPTTFVSATHAWTTLPDALRQRVAGLRVLHTAGEVRRGDLSDVLVTVVEAPPSTITSVGHPHPRTADTILYACEQMTREVVGMAPDESENLLEELFDHLYAPSAQFHHEWRTDDLVVWDNVAIQHARRNVAADGPTRTLRKVGCPLPSLAASQRPAYEKAM